MGETQVAVFVCVGAKDVATCFGVGKKYVAREIAKLTASIVYIFFETVVSQLHLAAALNETRPKFSTEAGGEVETVRSLHTAGNNESKVV